MKIFFFTKAFSDVSAMLGKISIDIALALVARIADLAVLKFQFRRELHHDFRSDQIPSVLFGRIIYMMCSVIFDISS